MELKEISEILLQLDSDRGRNTKIKILRCLKKKEMNANEIAVKLGIRSYSHVRKFLNILYDLYLVDKNTETFSGEYKEYNRNKWFLTNIGRQLIIDIKNVSLSKELTPNMFNESLKRKIRSSEKYKIWRDTILIRKKCDRCGIEGYLKAHHKIEFSKIIESEKIFSIEDAEKSDTLFDIKNGECLCLECHNNEHYKVVLK
jgi:hypothetical protein